MDEWVRAKVILQKASSRWKYEGKEARCMGSRAHCVTDTKEFPHPRPGLCPSSSTLSYPVLPEQLHLAPSTTNCISHSASLVRKRKPTVSMLSRKPASPAAHGSTRILTRKGRITPRRDCRPPVPRACGLSSFSVPKGM